MTSAASMRATLAVPLIGLLWGLNWPAVRIVLRELSPWALRSTGLGLGALVLFGFALARGQSLAVPRAHWPRLAVSALLNLVGFNLLVAFAQLAGTTSRAAALTYTMPVWAIALAWPVLGERLDGRRTVALATGVLGMGLLCLPVFTATQPWAGALLAIGGGVSWAAGTVFSKRFPVQGAPIPLTAWQLAIAALVVIAGMLAFEGLPVPHALTPLTWVALAYHVVLAMATGYFLWFEVVARLPAGTAALGTLMVPVVGIAGAMTLLGEQPSAADLAGFVLVMIAATIAMRAPPSAAPSPRS